MRNSRKHCVDMTNLTCFTVCVFGNYSRVPTSAWPMITTVTITAVPDWLLDTLEITITSLLLEAVVVLKVPN